jgi:uncharacterized membrane protein
MTTPNSSRHQALQGRAKCYLCITKLPSETNWWPAWKAVFLAWAYFSLVSFAPGYAQAQASEKPTFHCVGTEPFWALTLTQDKAWFTPIGESTQTSGGRWITPAGMLPSYAQHFLGDDLVAILVKQPCNDGMSDREYPYWVGVQNLNGSQGGYHGCCFPAEAGED